MVDGRHFKNRKIAIILVTIRLVAMKFGVMTHIEP